ncbi:MAG TPA: N-6 DNA methylase, partial [Pyrinomonadaceae bacterium]|nr:N-6 DNA methylase [Pyrinomonadaceae bacterium]
MSYLQRALENKLAQITGEDKERKITYLTLNITKRLDPEEQVRAEFWAELIYRYKYEPHRIGIEVTVPDRTPSDRADLIIFEDDRHTRPYAVIECKQDGISDAIFNQAIEQAFGNGIWTRFQAKYVMVVAGSTRRAFDFSAEKYGVLERERNIIADLPEHYGKVEEFKYYKGLEPDIRKVSRDTLITAIQKCHQTLWGGGKFSPPAAFGELCKLIFVKISDEKSTRKKQPYQFQIKTHETSRSLGERIRALYEAHKERDKDVFAETIKIDDAMLRTVVSHLESINLSATDLDTKGVAFEKFMDDFFKGNFGQYFTPREIINFAVQMIKPNRAELVLDPACGSGGFLLWALDAVR